MVETLAKKIEREYPGIYLCGYENGYVKDKDAVLERIAGKRAGYFTDCTGSPNAGTPDPQAYGVILKKGVLIGVGGSFDVLSGMKKRAPQFFVKCNLEWLYRIVTEPKRLKRFWNNNIKIFVCSEKGKP